MIDNTSEAGFSIENPVIIPASGSNYGVAAEYKWIEDRFGKRDIEWVLINNHVVHAQNDRWIDVLEIMNADDTVRELYFNISECFHPFERFVDGNDETQKGITIGELLEK